MDRRELLLTAAAGVFGGSAGCLSASSNPGGESTPATTTPRGTSTRSRSPTPVPFDADEEPFNDLSTDKSGTGFAQRGTVTLPEHRYAHLEVDLPERFHIDGTVRSDGSPFDFYMMPHRELERYAAGRAFEYRPDGSRLGTTDAAFEGEFPPEVYRLVFDNSGRGDAPPRPEVVIDFEWRIRPASGDGD